jgi:hypothetical protein
MISSLFPPEEKKLVHQLYSGGEVAGISRVYFSTDER